MADQTQRELVDVVPVSETVTARNDDCLICYESLKPENAAVVHTVCSNAFHQDCLREWVRQQPDGITLLRATCPMCRGAITDATLPLIDDDYLDETDIEEGEFTFAGASDEEFSDEETSDEENAAAELTEEERLYSIFQTVLESQIDQLKAQISRAAESLHDQALPDSESDIMHNIRHVESTLERRRRGDGPWSQGAISRINNVLGFAIERDFVPSLTARYRATSTDIYESSLRELPRLANFGPPAIDLEFKLERLRHRTAAQFTSLCNDMSNLITHRTYQTLLRYSDTLFIEDLQAFYESPRQQQESFEDDLFWFTQECHAITENAVERLKVLIPHMQFASDPVDYPDEDEVPYLGHLQTLSRYLQSGSRRRRLARYSRRLSN